MQEKIKKRRIKNLYHFVSDLLTYIPFRPGVKCYMLVPSYQEEYMFAAMNEEEEEKFKAEYKDKSIQEKHDLEKMSKYFEENKIRYHIYNLITGYKIIKYKQESSEVLFVNSEYIDDGYYTISGMTIDRTRTYIGAVFKSIKLIKKNIKEMKYWGNNDFTLIVYDE